MFRPAASSLPVNLRRLGLVALACSVAMLSACGGGNRAKDYQPDRVVSFGDENSAITTYVGSLVQKDGVSPGTLKGMVYTINTAVQLSTFSCAYQAPPYRECTSTDNGTAPSSGTYTTKYVMFDSNPASYVTKLVFDASSSTNQSTTQTVYSCSNSSIWVQAVAHSFSKGFQTQCPTDPYTNAVTYAEYGKRARDVVSQIQAHRGELTNGVLVTVMAGQWDILDMYDAVHGNSMTQASAEAELRARATDLANAIKDVLSTGAKVVLALTPDLGQSPKAVATGEDQALLSALTKVFNEYLYITQLGTQPGRQLAGVNPDPYTNPLTRSTSYVFNEAACDKTSTDFTHPDGTSVIFASEPDYVRFCTYATLKAAASTSVYMWADDIHFTPTGHVLIGSAGATRAANQF